ncbi:hypothetical protein ACPPVO_44450 [Dactylosporangium sp. McL0621]|uniref:hypothetical protein n=1 Tax=Dactylosporangium sp. McL0621 TaxID=3415678 RepID=UPI003CEAEE11
MSAYDFGEVLGCVGLCVCPIVVLIVFAVIRGRNGGTSGGTANSGAAGTWQPTAPKDGPCGSCGGSGTTYCCSGYEYVNGQPRNHHLCGGSGRLKCAMCGGSGRRSY